MSRTCRSSGAPGGQELVACTTHLSPGQVRVEVAGEVDLASADQLRSGLLAALARSRAGETLCVDLGGVSFLDARGISVLMEVHRTAGRAGITCRVDNPQEIVRQVLEVAGATTYLAIQPSAAPSRCPPAPQRGPDHRMTRAESPGWIG